MTCFDVWLVQTNSALGARDIRHADGGTVSVGVKFGGITMLELICYLKLFPSKELTI